MIVKQLETMHLFEAERCVEGKGFESIRFILEKDNMGFSLHKTIIPKGGPYHWHYTKHKEACYCIKGEGELVDLSTGNKYIITPDTIYILDNHDNHTFEAFEDIELISVFNPPVKGDEVHKEDGSYEI
jgi:L-ectoine synthase